MKRCFAFLAAVLPVLAIADGYPSGLSDQPAQRAASSEVQRLLEQQRQSGAPQRGELSTQLYVDSQKRIAETFRRPVPEPLSELGKSGD